MRVTIEDFVPYRESVLYRIQEAYYARRGLGAWSDGEVPHFSTSNLGAATQRASMLLAHWTHEIAASRRDPDTPFAVLEVGAGSGAFCQQALRALRATEPGRALLERLVWVHSDYAVENVRAAVAAHSSAARVLGACFDLRDAGTLSPVDGAELPAPFDAVIANYVCCVVPPLRLQVDAAGCRELFIAVDVDSDDERDASVLIEAQLEAAARAGAVHALHVRTEWRPADLATLAGDPRHEAAIRQTVAAFPAATLDYPRAFFDCLSALRGRLSPRAVVLVTDYGDPRADKLSGLQERSFQIYGNSPSRPVDFPAFDGFAAQFGWAIRRTTKPLRSLQTVLLSPAPLAEGIAAAFVDSHIADDLGERMLDDSLAADTCLQAGEATRAARLLERCVRIDPENADLQRRLAEALLEVPEPSLAIDTIRIGQALRDQNRVDWDFLSGRAECLLGRRNEAITAYQASAAREDHPSTRTNLGILYEELGDYAMAAAQYQRALELRPDYSRATDRLAQLKELTWENLLDEARAKSL